MFYLFYENMFLKLRIRLPLMAFENGVLRKLNVAPTKLDPNSWAFEILCKAISLMSTLGKFFYFFEFTNTKKTS